MYIFKTDTKEILMISDTLAYEENEDILVNEGKLSISRYLVDTIEESETIPDGWEKVGKVYQPIIIHPTEDELRQEGFDECIAMLMEEGVI